MSPTRPAWRPMRRTSPSWSCSGVLSTILWPTRTSTSWPASRRNHPVVGRHGDRGNGGGPPAILALSSNTSSWSLTSDVERIEHETGRGTARRHRARHELAPSAVCTVDWTGGHTEGRRRIGTRSDRHSCPGRRHSPMVTCFTQADDGVSARSRRIVSQGQDDQVLGEAWSRRCQSHGEGSPIIRARNDVPFTV